MDPNFTATLSKPATEAAILRGSAVETFRERESTIIAARKQAEKGVSQGFMRGILLS